MASEEISRQGRYTSTITFCRVCTDPTRYLHYGAFVCSSCKTFFRRCVSYTKNSLQCRFDGNCLITSNTRKTCAACRYAKCLVIGMHEDLIRKKDFSGMYMSKEKKILVESLKTLPTLNLLQADRSPLSTLQWTLLSNVVHAFDIFIPITQTRQTIVELSKKSSPMFIDLSALLSMFNTFYTSTEAFINSSPDFQILTLDEKSSVYQRNLHGVLHLCATFIYHLAGMFESSKNNHLLISSYGYEIFIQIKRIASQFDSDPVVIKLLLFILAFSSSCYVVDRDENNHMDRFLQGTFRLFGSQNVYLEVLWYYLIYRYDYYDAALRFARIIKHMLDLLTISNDAQQNNQMHQNFIEQRTVETEEILKTNEQELIPVWGKTPS